MTGLKEDDSSCAILKGEGTSLGQFLVCFEAVLRMPLLADLPGHFFSFLFRRCSLNIPECLTDILIHYMDFLHYMNTPYSLIIGTKQS